MTASATQDTARMFTLLNRMAPMGVVPAIKAFRQAVNDTGGAYVVPQAGDRTGSHLVEVRLYGVTAIGRDEMEAICNWKRVAVRCLDTPEDPAPVADVTLQVTTRDKAGSIGTAQVLIDGNTPAHKWLEAAGIALIRQTHMEGQTIVKVSIVAMQNNAKVQPLEDILRNDNDRQVAQ